MIDLISMKLMLWDETMGSSYDVVSIPADRLEEAMKERERMVEHLADFDDEIMELFLAGERIDEKKIRQAVRKVTVEERLIPVLCGSALRNKGIQLLIDGIIDYLPSPLEVKPVLAHDKTTMETIPVSPDSKGPLVAYVFKVYMDEGRRMVYLRIYSGVLQVGGEVYNTTRGVSEKVARLFAMHAHVKQRIEQASAGDIVAAVGLKDSVTGDTLAMAGESIVLEAIDIQKPVISMAIEPKSTEYTERLQEAMRKIMEEDPTIKVHEDPDTGQVILAGMGELHLEIALDRFRTAFGVEINVGKPQVLYCATVERTTQAEKVFDKLIGETLHHGHVELTVKPSRRGSGNAFHIDQALEDGLKGHIMNGLEEACLADPEFGYEVVDIDVLVNRVVMTDKTTGQGLKIASQMALQDAMKKAGVVQLEPIMELDALSPEDYVGDVVGDLSARKASIEGVVTKGKQHLVKAYVPLSNTFGYSTALRSLTRGRGSFSMRFSGFDRV